jgi:hypothetical protein
VPCHLCGTYRRVKLIRHKSCGVADTHTVIYTLVILHPGNVQGTLRVWILGGHPFVLGRRR